MQDLCKILEDLARSWQDIQCFGRWVNMILVYTIRVSAIEFDAHHLLMQLQLCGAIFSHNLTLWCQKARDSQFGQRNFSKLIKQTSQKTSGAKVFRFLNTIKTFFSCRSRIIISKIKAHGIFRTFVTFRSLLPKIPETTANEKNPFQSLMHVT